MNLKNIVIVNITYLERDDNLIQNITIEFSREEVMRVWNSCTP